MRSIAAQWRAIFAVVAFFAALNVCSNAARADQMDARLDDLFARLATTPNATEASEIENSIWAIWMEHSDERAQRYMFAGIRQLNEGQVKEALTTFTRLIEMEPNFAEAWNKRATVYYLLQDYDASARDIAETLKLERRHFGALSGLGLVNIALGRSRAAITAFEMALAHHPHLRGAQQNIKNLKDAMKENERPI